MTNSGGGKLPGDAQMVHAISVLEPAADPPKRPRGRSSKPRSLVTAAFLSPTLLLVALFLFVPLILAFVISFQKLGALGGAQWLGFNNYVDLFHDSVFWESLLNTAIFTVITVPLSLAIGLGLAMLLNTVLPGRLLYRSIIFLPLVISGVANGLLGSWMFDQYNGFVNKVLDAVGISGPLWQTSGTWSMASIIIVTVWQRVGFAMIIYLAGMQGVGADLLESASIDGCTSWQRFRYITFPLLGPSTFFLLIMNVIYSFQVFDTVWAMTRGGPGYSTTTIVTYAYRTSFDEHGPQQLGYGAAVGVVIYLLTLIFTAIQWNRSQNRDQAG